MNILQFSTPIVFQTTTKTPSNTNQTLIQFWISTWISIGLKSHTFMTTSFILTVHILIFSFILYYSSQFFDDENLCLRSLKTEK